jgi:hypothetical protein
MKIYNDICNGASTNPGNTGSKSECLESVMTMFVLAKDSFSFASVAAMKDIANWNTAIQNRDIAPFPEVYELTPNNTDATFYESRNFRKRTQKATKITDVELYLGYCSHAALKAYENSEYNRVFEITEDGDVLGVYAEDGIAVQGQKLKNFDVGIRTQATVDKPPFTPVSMTFADHEEVEKNAVLVTPDFDPVDDLEGVYGVSVNQSGAGSATLITFTAFAGCSDDVVTGLENELTLVGADGTTDQSATIAAIGNGTYTATGTGFVSGYITTGGVVAIDGLLYEVHQAVTVA